jgi:hypothetical protein
VVTQQRVELKYATTPHKSGTVSKVFSDGSFKVSYDSYRDDKGHRVSGGRIVYPARMATAFTVTA